RMLSVVSKRHPPASCALHNECNPCPFAPSPLQTLQHYYEQVRPYFPMRAENRFSRSLLRPDPDSCCLNNGCRTVSSQVSTVLIGARLYKPVLTPAKISLLHRSVHFRSTFWTVHDSNYSAFSRNAHHRPAEQARSLELFDQCA